MKEQQVAPCLLSAKAPGNEHNGRKVKVVFWLTTVVMVLEIAAGTWSGSMALLADGWHMGTHSAAFLLAIFAYSYAQKHANSGRFSFGTGKVNYLGGFASAVALAIVALMMVIESLQRLFDPEHILFNEAISVAIVGLVVNVASVLILHDDHTHDHAHGHTHAHDHPHNPDDAHHHESSQGHDHNMKAAYFHVLADTLTSVLAIAALLVGKYLGLYWMDPLMGIVGALVIGRWSYGLIQESSAVLLDQSIDQQQISEILAQLHANAETTVHDLHIWRIAESQQAAMLSLSSTSPLPIEAYQAILKKRLPQLSHITIEIGRV
jgi:cation diffusion facilitator family transporter